jgi:hypothetical protein
LETKLPWCEYPLQKVAQHADSDNIWHGVPYRFLAKENIKQGSEKMAALRMSLSSTMSLNVKARAIIIGTLLL